MSRSTFRQVDSGLRSGRQNIALDQAMVEAHSAGEIPDTLRFISFKPCVLLGRHQALSQEVNADYCHSQGIEIGRRITGGGAIYMDEGVLGWALICQRSALGGGALGDLTARICGAAAAGLSRLGVTAKFRPRNDIEIEGRKISGTGGFFDGNTLIYQGTILVDPKPDIMFQALNVARDKYAKHGLKDAAQRVTSLVAELGRKPSREEIITAMSAAFGEELGLDMEDGELSELEESYAAQSYLDEIGTDAFVAEIDDPSREAGVLVGRTTGAGGQVVAYLRLEGPNDQLIREVLFSGDFFVTPPRFVFDLEAHLRGTQIEQVADTVKGFFQEAEVGLLSVTQEDFTSAVQGAAQVRSVRA